MQTLHVTWCTFKTFLENCRRKANTSGSGEKLWRDQCGPYYLDETEAELHQLLTTPERLRSMWQYWNSLHLTTFFYMKPDFLALCPPDILERIEGSDWSWLLKRVPDKCHLEKLSRSQVEKLPLGNKALAQQLHDKWHGWGNLDGDAWGKLLNKNRIFKDKCEQFCDKLRKADWKSLLYAYPEFADKCHCWEEFDNRELMYLLRRDSTFADKCDLTKLDGSDWVILLHEDSKSFADKCYWTQLKDYDWMNLLSVHPQYADKCDLAKLNGDVWVNLLLAQPQFAENDIPWQILTGDNTSEKYLQELEQKGFWRNEFWKDEKNKETLMLILENYPKISLFFPWEHFQNADFYSILNKLKPDVLLQLWKDKPQLVGGRIHDWSSFTPDNLRKILCEHPELANEHVLERLDLHNAAMLLKEQWGLYQRFEDIFLDKQQMPGTSEDRMVITLLWNKLHGVLPSTYSPNGTIGKTGEHKHILNENNIPLLGKQLRGQDGRFEPFDT